MFCRDLGWGNWIISPSKLRANFCKGDCDLGVVAPEYVYNDMMQKSNKNYKCLRNFDFDKLNSSTGSRI